MTAFVLDNPTPLRSASVADIGEVSDAELIEMMVAARRAASRVQAVELAAVAELARRRDAEDAESGVGVVSARDYLHDEVAAALTLTATSADDLVRFATELTGRLPATFAALAAGELDYAKARTVWHAVAQVDAEMAAEIEERLLPRAAEQTTGQIRAKVRRLVKRLDPDALARRRERAERSRDVQLVPTDGGTAHLSGVDLPAEAATAACNRVNAIAAGLKADGDRRGMPQLRADVFLALLSGTMTSTEPPADSARLPASPAIGHETRWTDSDDAIADLIAHVTREQLTALSDGIAGRDALARHRGQAGQGVREPQRGPAGGRGLERRQGPVGAAELIADAAERIADSLTALKTRWCQAGQAVHAGEPRQAGQVGQQGPAGESRRPGEPGQAGQAGRREQGAGRHGHEGYRVPARMRRLLERRDRRCGFPGCRRPVRHCDADHTLAYHRGGPTCPCNLAMLCRHHHMLKQTHRWRLYQPWPGVLLWITPTGHWRVTAPADRE